MIKKIIIFVFLCLTNIFAQNDQTTIRGRIVDGQNLFPLSFANIAYENKQIGTSSDEDGNFSISYYKNSNIIFSFIGYKSIVVNSDDLLIEQENLITLFPIEIYLQEVTVYSSQNSQNLLNESNAISIKSKRIRESSSAMPDILRSVQTLPGIAVNNEFKANFNVRGGNQDENLVYVNGARVYEPYHIKEAANASVGIFNVDLIKKVDLITGGFSARYGDKMSSVLNIDYREGSKEDYGGALSLSAAYADAYLEGPISGNSSFILGIRKSYMEYILSQIDYDNINTAQPSFYDIQGVLNYNFSPSNKLVLEFIHAGDDFSYLPSSSSAYVPYIGFLNGEQATFKTNNVEEEKNKASYFSNLFDLKSINVLSSNALLSLELSYYSQIDNEYRLFERNTVENATTLSSNTFYFDSLKTNRYTIDSLTIETLEAKATLQYQLSPFYEINTGISYKDISYDHIARDIWTYTIAENMKNANNVYRDTLSRLGSYGNDIPVNTRSYKFSAYLENIISIGKNLTLNLGGRIDYFDINQDLNLSPRINLAYNLGNNTILRAAWGHYYQSPDYRQLKSSASSDTNTTAQKAIHYIAGIEKTFYFSKGSFIQLKIEGYYKDYSNVISSWYGTFERLTYSRENDALGNASGLDTYLVFNLPGFYSWISYGLLFANEDKINDNYGEYARYTDQRNSLSIVTNFDLGKNWDLSLKGFYGSGFPYTPKNAKLNDNNEWYWEEGEINSSHLPAYKRVDIRMGKTFEFSKSELNVFIDISNVFNFKNIQQYEYKVPGYTKPVVEEIELWPIVPSFGIRWLF